MTRRFLLMASAIVVALMLGAAMTVGSSLPRGLPLPIHWGLDGQADAFAGKWIALLMPVVVTVPLVLLLVALPAIEPRKLGMARSQGAYHGAWAGMLLMGPLLQLAVVSAAYRWPIHSTSFVLAGVGLLFILIGSQLGKSRSTYLMGIRTPWTLASEDVWIKTHRLGGKLMAGGGLVLLAAAFVPLPSPVILALLPVIAAAALIPVLYSYILWRREQSRPGI